jgi:hypothetical protein
MCQDPPYEDLILKHPRADLRAEAFRRILETKGTGQTEGYGYYFAGLVEEMHGREALRGPSYDYNHLREFVSELSKHDWSASKDSLDTPDGRNAHKTRR